MKPRHLILQLVGSLAICSSFAQVQRSERSRAFSTVDLIRVKDGHQREARFYYENNWKKFRDSSYLLGHIRSYTLLEMMPDSLREVDFILVTDYEDSAHYEASENFFAEYIKRRGSNWPALMNGLKPAEFREVRRSYAGYPLHHVYPHLNTGNKKRHGYEH